VVTSSTIHLHEVAQPEILVRAAYKGSIRAVHVPVTFPGIRAASNGSVKRQRRCRIGAVAALWRIVLRLGVLKPTQ